MKIVTEYKSNASFNWYVVYLVLKTATADDRFQSYPPLDECQQYHVIS